MSALPPTTEVGRRIVVSVWLSVYELVCLQLDEFAAEFLRLLPLLSAQASIAQAGHATALSSPGIVGSTRYPSSPVCGLLSDTSGAFHLYLSRLLPTHQGAAFSMLSGAVMQCHIALEAAGKQGSRKIMFGVAAVGYDNLAIEYHV